MKKKHLERMYKKDVAHFIHKNRLQVIYSSLQAYVPPSAKSWSDFGCGSGFVIQELVNKGMFQFERIVGYDHSVDTLNWANAKNIPNAEFKYFNLNEITQPEERFDLVTCFETLEHVGNYKNALTNLYNYLNETSHMVITIPNEVGVVGLVKFFGRLAVRRRPYGDFFNSNSRVKYVSYLIANKHMDGFRAPDQPRYGPHLGFDYRKIIEYIDDAFISNSKLELVDKIFTSSRMNIILIFRKTK